MYFTDVYRYVSKGALCLRRERYLYFHNISAHNIELKCVMRAQDMLRLVRSLTKYEGGPEFKSSDLWRAERRELLGFAVCRTRPKFCESSCLWGIRWRTIGQDTGRFSWPLDTCVGMCTYTHVCVPSTQYGMEQER